MIQNSSTGRVLSTFAWDIAHQAHSFSKFSLQIKKNQLEERKRRWLQADIQAEQEERRMKETQIQQQAPAPSTPITQQTANTPQGNPLSTDWDSHPMFDVIFQHFSNELRPNILSKFPTAPADKVAKVIQQKWKSIDPQKKDAFAKKTLRKIEQQQQMQQNNPSSSSGLLKQQAGEQQYDQSQAGQVMVKQEQPQDEIPPQNRFQQYLTRIPARQEEKIENPAQRMEEEEPQVQGRTEGGESSYHQQQHEQENEQQRYQTETQKMQEEE